MKSVSLFGALMLAVPLAACGHSGQAVDGQVLEYGTRAPIVGAIVVARWNGTYFTPWESSMVCGHVETATTDASGRFHIPAWTERPRAINFFMGGGFDYLDVYKAGYSYYWWPAYFKSQDFKQNILFMQKFKGSREERMSQLQHLYAYRCNEQTNSRLNLVPLWKAAYDEAKRISETTQDWTFTDGFLDEVDIARYGRDEGLRRSLERADQRRFGRLKEEGRTEQ